MTEESKKSAEYILAEIDKFDELPDAPPVLADPEKATQLLLAA